MAIDQVLGFSFLPLAQTSDPAALASAVVQLYRECGLDLETIHTNHWPRARVYREQTFRDVVLEPATRHVSLWHELVPEVTLYLRPADATNLDFEARSSAIISARLPPEISDALRRFMVAIVELYPLSQGSVAIYRSPAHAGKECCFSGAFSGTDLDPETRVRLGKDQRSRQRAQHKLRRLYPVTIIGPEIWSQLPPMPAFDPMPTIEDLGNCKMLTCWPELVEPRDPAFLAGTKELRKWLWPYTIQNPADAVDLDSPDQG